MAAAGARWAVSYLECPRLQPRLSTVTSLRCFSASALGEPLHDEAVLPLSRGTEPEEGSWRPKAQPAPQLLPAELTMTVHAHQLGTTLNLQALRRQPDLTGLHAVELQGRDSILLVLDPAARIDGPIDTLAPHGLPPYPYLVALNHGSVVLYNVRDERLRSVVLAAARRCASAPPGHPMTDRQHFTEEFQVKVRPEYVSFCDVSADTILLKSLDLQVLGLVSRVLGQSVAMEQCNSYVNEMLQVFHEINQLAVETGKFDHKYGAAQLLQFVARNNIIYSDALYKLRVLDKHPTAWKYQELDKLWTQLRNELEIESRYETLTVKLDLVQDSLKYFLELAHNRKSDWLELTIVILIAMEICLGLYEIWTRAAEI